MINLNKDTLAFQVQQIQEKLHLPGLTKECKQYIMDLDLPNIFVEQISGASWKMFVKRAILKAN